MARGLLGRQVKLVTLQQLFFLLLTSTAVVVEAENQGKTKEGELSLSPLYYAETCPLVEEIVRVEVESAVYRDPRVAAQLLRLHFHDCFVMGCDASLLLDTSGDIVSEKEAGPNLNSLRGFDIIDQIKASLEEACPLTVSCADILAIAARDAVLLRGGPEWEVLLGRKDSLKSSFTGASKYIPSPNFTLPMLISNFHEQGLDITDLVALSGSHTIGRSRCLSFKEGIYDPVEEEWNRHYHRSVEFRRSLRSICPESGTRDSSLVPLDTLTSTRFDNHYYFNLISGMGLLQSDRALVSPLIAPDAVVDDEDADLHRAVELVWAYAADQDLFFRHFASSIVKMGNIHVLTGSEGEIRHNCHYPNA